MEMTSDEMRSKLSDIGDYCSSIIAEKDHPNAYYEDLIRSEHRRTLAREILEILDKTNQVDSNYQGAES